MKRAFVLGHPVAHSRSPLIHGHWLREHGIAGSYERIDVAPERLPDFLRTLPASGFAGGNVTVPLKEIAFRCVDVRTEEAARLGAVNTLSFDADGRLVGHNTDGAGFVRSVDEALGPDWAGPGLSALVLGAGGAARAVVGALLDRGVGTVTIANRTTERAAEIAASAPHRIRVVDWAAIPDVLPTAGLLVNTTSLGMNGRNPIRLPLDRLPADAVVADNVYVPLETALLADARARGLRAVDGLGMLLHQAVPGFARWFGVRPVVTPALRAVVEADLGVHAR